MRLGHTNPLLQINKLECSENTNSPRAKTFEVCQSAGEVCGMFVSSGMKGSYTLNLCFMNPNAYGDTLRRLRKAIHRKRPDLCHEA